MSGKVHNGAFNKVVTKMLMSNIQGDWAEEPGGGLPSRVLPSEAVWGVRPGVTMHSDLLQLQGPP